MNWINWTVVVAAVAATLVAAAGGILTEIGPWYRDLRKPSWQPPNWAFAPAWTVIFALAATSAVLCWDGAASVAGRAAVAVLFAINGVFNVAWSGLFFKLRRPDWALREVVLLWLSILSLLVMAFQISSPAGWCLVPYLAWVSFAAFLNLTIVRLNQPFAGRVPAQARADLA